MGDTRRWIAFFLFTLGVMLLFNLRLSQRQREMALKAKQEAETRAARGEGTTDTLQSVAKETGPTTAAPAVLRKPEPGDETAIPAMPVDRETAPTVTVETKTCRVLFSTVGAVPLRWELRGLAASASGSDSEDSTRTIDLIPNVSFRQREYPLTLEARPLELFNEVPFVAERRDRPDGGVELVLTSEERKGLQVVKKFEFADTGYLIPFTVTVLNRSEMRKLFSDNDVGLGVGWQGGFMQPEENSRVAGFLAGLVMNASGLHAENLKIDQEAVTFVGPIQWVGVERKFFLAALVPGKGVPASSAVVTVRERDVTEEYRRKGIAAPVSVVLQHERFELEPGQSKEFGYFLFAGPKSDDLLQEADRVTGLTGRGGLAATMFHGYWGIIRWLALVLLDVLKWLHGLVQNYGYATILLTILVRVVTYPLTHKSMKIQAKTMAQQAKLKPYIDEINKKYKDNAAQRNQAMMKLWKEHGVNPFGMLRGCVPILLQMPIFIAFYVVLDQAIELRGQSFLWISDLSMPDRLLTFHGMTIPLLGNSLNILPILMGLTQVVASKMSMSAAVDPTQRQMMIIMPIAFIFFLYSFPSGLMLYWVVTNLWQIGQQKFTNRLIQREQAVQAAPARG